MKLNVITGLDIGNGYVKGRYQDINKKGAEIDIASCVAGVPSRPNPADTPEVIMDDIFDNLVCSFHSPLVAGRRFAFGSKGIKSDHLPLEFNISAGSQSKADQELSSILILGCVASAALKNYYDANGQLPTDVLNVDAYIALALPINEYQTHRGAFAKKFMTDVHEVIVENFDQDVFIRITFKNVSVLAEGVSAQFAISSKGEKFAEALLADVRSRDPKALEGITAKDIAECVNTCGIDIGEGTVNFPVINPVNGKPQFNSFVSSTISLGYGTVLEHCLPELKNRQMPFTTRKVLADFLTEEPDAFTKNKITTIKSIIANEAQELVDVILSEISKILASGQVRVIYVYGGGATPMRDLLYDALANQTKYFAGGDAFPILYLDSYYSRNLNREGLYQVAVADFEYQNSKK